MAKWSVQPFIIYILAVFHIFPCSKRQIKRENEGKKTEVIPSSDGEE